MKKLIYLLILVLVAKMVMSITVEENFTFNPSLSNVTYRMNKTFNGITTIKVNETCLQVDDTIWCNQSATYITINISAIVDDISPTLSNLINTSTTNQSSVINWTTNENTNASLTYGICPTLNTSSLTDSDISLTHNFTLLGLSNSTIYCINASSVDSSGNIGYGLFNFTTASNIPITLTPSQPSVGGGVPIGARGGGCDPYADQYQTCYFINDDLECEQGCQQGYICNQYYRCVLEQSWIINTLDYYIFITTSKDKYKINENILANITLVNKNKNFDNDGVLTTYLISPNNDMFKLEQYNLDIICPACYMGEYDKLHDACVGDNISNINATICENTGHSLNKVTILRKMAVPMNSTLGDWIFYATYESKHQSPVMLYSRFKLATHRNYLWILISIPIMIAFATINRKRKRRKKIKFEKMEVDRNAD